MNQKHRFLTLILTLALTAAATGCGSKQDDIKPGAGAPGVGGGGLDGRPTDGVLLSQVESLDIVAMTQVNPVDYGNGPRSRWGYPVYRPEGISMEDTRQDQQDYCAFRVNTRSRAEAILPGENLHARSQRRGGDGRGGRGYGDVTLSITPSRNGAPVQSLQCDFTSVLNSGRQPTVWDLRVLLSAQFDVRNVSNSRF